jgi:hypothetical protein
MKESRVNANSCRTLVAAVALTATLGMARPAFCDVIADWNEKAAALLQPRMPPPPAFRAMAMLNVAMFDAVNSVERRYQPYLTQLNAAPATSREAAAAGAAAAVLVALLPQARDEVKSALARYLDVIPNGKPKTDGIELGESVAARILETRANDGSNAPDAYRPRTTPGAYVPTAPALATMWPSVKPFAMTGPAQFRPEPPLKLDSAQWAADYNEIKELGSKNSTARSAKQTEDARFWLLTGPQAYFPIALQLVTARKMGVVDSARFMTLGSIAMADSLLAVFDAKYHYAFWRPVTAIRNGDLMDPATISRDATWQPIDATPMHPEYPCAHCITAASLAAVIEAVIGTDLPQLTATSPTAPDAIHRWTNMQAFVREVSEARISAGFHYRFSTRVGEQMGYRIGDHVVKNLLQPVALATR